MSSFTPSLRWPRASHCRRPSSRPPHPAAPPPGDRLARPRPPPQPLSAALIATAQLGVPAAVVQIGLQEHVITPGLGAAVTLAALATLGLCSLGTHMLARR